MGAATDNTERSSAPASPSPISCSKPAAQSTARSKRPDGISAALPHRVSRILRRNGAFEPRRRRKSPAAALTPKPIPGPVLRGQFAEPHESPARNSRPWARKENAAASDRAACWFHQPANGNNGGAKLSSSNRSALPQTPTTGFFMSMPVRSMDKPDQSSSW